MPKAGLPGPQTDVFGVEKRTPCTLETVKYVTIAVILSTIHLLLKFKGHAVPEVNIVIQLHSRLET